MVRDPLWLPSGRRLVHSLSFLVGVAAVAAAPVVSGALAFRALGEAGRGELAVAVVSATIGAILAVRGIDGAILSSRLEPVGEMSLIANRRVATASVGEAVAAAVIAAAIIGRFNLVHFAGVAVLTLASADYSLSKAINVRGGRALRVTSIDLLLAVLTVISAAGASRLDTGSTGYLWAFAIPFVTVAGVGRVIDPVRRRMGHPDPEVFELLQSRSRPLLVSRGLVVMAFRVDRLMLAVIVGLSGAGIYAAAIPIAEIVGLAPLHLAQMSSVELSDGATRWWAPVPARVGITISVALLAIVIVLAEVIVKMLYGASSDEIVRIVRILAVASFVSGLWRLAEAEVVARGDARLTVAPAATAAGIVITVTAVLAWRLGAAAAAIGSLVGYGLALFMTNSAARGKRAMESNGT